MTDYVYDEPAEFEPSGGRAAKAQKAVNAAGALVSLGLVAGMCVWGYQLLVRDVSGVPVIEALEGAFRVAPEDPGGMTAPHQGLQVNEIAAVGSASGPVDQVRLAPGEMPLTAEDRPWGELLEEREAIDTAAADVTTQMALVDASASPAPVVEADEGDATAADEPIVDRPEDADPVELAIAEALSGTMVDEDAGSAAVLRPLARPEEASGTYQVASVQQLSAPAGAAAAGEVSVSDLPKGTRLVQLGAFVSPEIAREEWGALTGRFGDFFTDKRMVVQEAVSGGKTFFRLRAEGFDDLADARRFCSALTAQRADCIPVEVR